MILQKTLQICILWARLRITPINSEGVSYSDSADKTAIRLPDELVTNGRFDGRKSSVGMAKNRKMRVKSLKERGSLILSR